MSSSASTVFLDVNETLLDLSALDSLFEDALGDAGARRQWFGLLLQLALTQTVIGDYHDFKMLGEAALSALGQTRGQVIPSDLPAQVAAAMRQLPPHPDTAEALMRLREGGARLYALTNNPLAVLEAQLKNAGLHDLFDGALSVDEAHHLKPHRAAYEYGLRRAGAEASGSWLIAAHGWDIAGAKAVGMKTGFVERAGQAQNPLGLADVSGSLSEVVEAVLTRLD
ncbi:haloacid dehalogenase type II [Deinococcus psychrotolerans]|uniref:Haloacid dehalogenase type II n=1 Tax=Deinococcus psychrotolerans TaxID=2489213 RepID=A0A3G8Y8T1_9DEIO|nr:haloacid dehalogenase type II [Deinococcus psychrotolerans]AZI41360.1 haloacid dehalogenase type II [Deinococcus psychrotolerans]